MRRRLPLASLVLTIFASNALALPLALAARNSLAEERTNVPVTWSVPLAIEDAIRDATALQLVAGGTEIPGQFTVLARWGGRSDQTDKPIAWLLIDTRLDLEARETVSVTLVNQRSNLISGPLAVVRDDSERIVIATGAATYELSRTAFRLFDKVTLATGESFSSGSFRYNGRDVGGPCSLAVEQKGRERISLIGRGTIEGDLEYTLRLHFYRDLAVVKAELRIENLAAPRIVEGQPQDNDYGSQGSVSFDDLTLRFATRGGNGYEIPAGELGASGSERSTFTSGIAVIQGSSGDAHWDALRTMTPRLQSGVTKRASTIRRGETEADGPNQGGGWLDAGGVTVAVQDAWQNFPKSLRATDGTIEAGLFPSEYSVNHQLRPGEFKTHTIWIRHHGGASDVAARARSLLAPVRLLPSADHASRTLALGMMAPRMTSAFPDYESGVDYQLAESPAWRQGEYEARTILDAISLSQNYGWVDYGDVPTDFEVATSPYNMKYDSLRGLLWQSIRTDDDRWWSMGMAAARHVADIDVHHSRIRGYSSPRHWFDGGIYGHGYHDEDGRLNPHRNYMQPSTSMAGPAAGLFLWALASGDTLLMDSARETADNLYWKSVNSNYDEIVAGGAACARSAGLQTCGDTCDGYEPADVSRTGGHAAEAMITAYLATGDSTYLEFVRRLAAYAACTEPTLISPTCNRFNIQTTFIRALGHYLVLRQALSLPEDTTARNFLKSRMDFMTGTLWVPSTKRFQMCYFDDPADMVLAPMADNWLLAVADAFAGGALVLQRTDLLTEYAQPVFRFGSANQFYEGSAISYHSTKEFVNQVGYGQMFLYAWSKLAATPPSRRRPVRP